MARKTLVLKQDGTFEQQVTVKGSGKTFEAWGTWEKDPGDDEVSFDGMMVVLDYEGNLAPNFWKDTQGLCILPAYRQMGKAEIGGDDILWGRVGNDIPYTKQEGGKGIFPLVAFAAAFVFVALWGFGTFLLMVVEWGLGTRFVSSYFRWGPSVFRDSCPIGGKQEDAWVRVRGLLEGEKGLAVRWLPSGAGLLRDRLHIGPVSLGLPPVGFIRLWLGAEDENGRFVLRTEARPHLGWLLFLLTPVLMAAVVMVGNHDLGSAVFATTITLVFVGLFLVELKRARRRAEGFWRRLNARVEE